MSLWLSPDRPVTTGDASAAAGPARPALFLDRDGCLIEERHYLSDPEQVVLIPGVTTALRRAREAGFLLIGVSNQSGIGRGKIDEHQLDAVMSRLSDLLAAADAALDAFFYCPHAPRDRCDCRKPAPGLLEEASAQFAWDRATSWVIGDKLSDVDLALGAGLAAALVRTGYGRAEEAVWRARDATGGRVLVADDLAAAVSAILKKATP